MLELFFIILPFNYLSLCSILIVWIKVRNPHCVIVRENVCVELNIVKRYQTQLILEGVLEFFIAGQLHWDNLTLGIQMINLKIRAFLLYVL